MLVKKHQDLPRLGSQVPKAVQDSVRPRGDDIKMFVGYRF